MMYGAGEGVNWASIILEILKVLLDLTDMEFSITGITRGSDGKDSACSAGDLGLIPGSGRAPGEGSGNPLQYSWPGKFHRGACWATDQGVTKSQKRLSN